MPAPRMVFMRMKDAVRAGRALSHAEANMVRGVIVTRLGTHSHELFTELLACLPAAEVSGKAGGPQAEEIARCIDFLFSVCCSPSGFDVHLSGPTVGAVGILILGFSGASPKAMQPLIDLYGQLLPGSRIIVATSPEVECLGDAGRASAEAQLGRIADEASGCNTLLLHALSNNGFGLWMRLQQAHSEVGTRLVGAVFDCGISANPNSGGSFSADGWAMVLCKTVLSVMAGEGWAPLEAGQSRHDVTKRLKAACNISAARLAAQRDPFGPMHAWQLANEPPVRTLCLSSSDDDVIPARAVHEYAERLRTQQPSRLVTEVVLPGAHCQLLQASAGQYNQTIRAFLSTLPAAVRDLATSASAPGQTTSAGPGSSSPLQPSTAKRAIEYDPTLDEPVGSMAKVEELQADLLADDVELTDDMASVWTLRRLTHYLETGGDDQPSLQTDVVLPGVLQHQQRRPA